MILQLLNDKIDISFIKMDESFNLRGLIKQFLSRDPQFRNPTFDPAPFLIEILKEKQADHEALIERQNQLIETENQCRELIDDICSQCYEDFLKFVEVPEFYAQNLEKLKSNVSVVKKKVKQAKSLLLNTQKDIQQVHHNCLFNKIIYKKLKQIQLRLYQYETAYAALKNNQFLLCSFNLPNIEGKSILQSALAARAEALRLRMLTKAIDEINLFIFFTPKVILPSSSVYLDRINSQNNEQNIIGNWQQHQHFFKRFKLFKKVDWKEYLSKIWVFQDLERKEGKLGAMYDIIKAVMNVGRIQQITSSIEINGKKQINNLFTLLKYFRIKDISEDSIPKRWFVDRCTFNNQGKKHISAVLCVIGVLIRKNLIIQKIYQQFEIQEYRFTTQCLYDFVLSQLKSLIQITYFPNQNNLEINTLNDGNPEVNLYESLKKKMTKLENYTTFGYAGYVIRKSLGIIEKNLIQIHQNMNKESQVQGIKGKGNQLWETFHIKFYDYFHKDFCETIKLIFHCDGRIFLTQSFQSIIGEKQFNEDEIKYMKNFRSSDKKAVKQYIFVISLLKSLEQFFNLNHLEKEKLYKYTLLVLVLFYLKLNYHVLHHILKKGEMILIRGQRKSDKKLRKKEEEFARLFYKISPDKQTQQSLQKRMQKVQSKNSGNKEAINSLALILGAATSNKMIPVDSQISIQMIVSKVISYNVVDKTRVFQKQNQMFLSFSNNYFHYIEGIKNSQNVLEYFSELSRMEPANYQDNIQARTTRIWNSLPDSQAALKQFTAATLYKIFELSCVINAKIYRETSSY